jgi:hypothetical protein
MNPELNILTALEPCHPRGLREGVLNSELRVRGTRMSLTDQRRHCESLEAKGHVTVTATEDFTLIKITAEGLARIAE